MNPRLRIYEFLATPAHAYLWLIAQLLRIHFAFRIGDASEPDEGFFAQLTPELLNHIKKCSSDKFGGGMVCPRCSQKYRDHKLGEADPCVS